ncbi:hypothetical protein GCM10011405_00260 [Rufibacter glacialis]|nr:hypothetical protein GCM10011405_00260 [Rufibacter glacialis]
MTISKILERVSSQPLLKELYDYVFHGHVKSILKADYSSIPQAKQAMLYSLGNNNSEEASNIYYTLCQRVPEKDSTWIYDDILVFLVTCTVAKFHLNKDWILKILDFWKQTIDEERNLLSTTCRNFLEGHSDLTNTYAPLLLLLVDIRGDKDIKPSLILKAFQEGWRSEPTFNLEVLNLAHIRGTELSILYSDINNYEHNRNIRLFENNFINRIEKLSKFLSLFVHFIITIIAYIIFIKFPLIKDYFGIKKILEFLISGGIGISSLYFFKDRLENYIRKILYNALGYIKS